MVKKSFAYTTSALAGGVGIESLQDIKGGYAIRNVQTGKNLRPYRAGTVNGNKIVIYHHAK